MRWLLRYALLARRANARAGEMQDTNPDNGPAVRLEIGGPEGSCTLIFPADNGALCWLSYGSGMVGGAGNAPVVTSDSYLRHRFYRPAAGTPPKLARRAVARSNLEYARALLPTSATLRRGSLALTRASSEGW